MAKRAAPEVNAGSMADIAFLLLIFFLVTTTIEKDKGILRSLPPIDDSEIEPPIIKQKNLFTVLLNRHDQLLVEEEEMDVKNLRQAAIDFLDNGGGENAEGETCTYCRGKKDPTSSDHP
ncbi:MAG: biopolymer transporter ExbD, partial [Winogradskyella sp.]|nr:biopolymer transporter ExbD [Winogradskyella sp.]